MNAEKKLMDALLVAHHYARTGQVYEEDHEELVASVLRLYSHDPERDTAAPMQEAVVRLQDH